eukprot:1137501-Pelagomonas_calceolata.AAC.3
MVFANSAENLQFQLKRFHEYARHKGLTLKTSTTKVVFFSTAHPMQLPTFEYNGTALEAVTELKYLGILLRCDGKMKAATSQMAQNMPYFGSFKSLHLQGLQGLQGKKASVKTLHLQQAYTDAKYELQENFLLSQQRKLQHMSIIQASSSVFWVYHEILELSSQYKQCPPGPGCASRLTTC